MRRWLVGLSLALVFVNQAVVSETAIDAFGIDDAGWFHAPEEQEQVPEHVLLLLEDLDLAEGILARGTIHTVKSLEDDHTLFKGVMTLELEDAEQLGVSELEVAIKPAGKSFYGGEYKRELSHYKLSRYLGLTSLIPVVERDIDYEPLAEQVKSQLTRRQKKHLSVWEEEDGSRRMHGMVQLWVVGYLPMLGYYPTSMSRLKRMANALKPESHLPVYGDPAWQALSDMYVVDFVVYNDDRSREAGSVRLADGGHRLVLLDNGDSLWADDPDETAVRARELFERVQLFSPNVLEGLETLDKEAVASLLVDGYGEPLAKANHLRRVRRRAREAAARIRALGEEHGGLEAVLFDQPSRSMVEGR